jgi:hypothetical protein
VIATSRSGSRKGSGRSKTAFTTLKIVPLAPMPRARVKTAMPVKPGLLPSLRSAYRASCQMLPMLLLAHPGQAALNVSCPQAAALKV